MDINQKVNNCDKLLSYLLILLILQIEYAAYLFTWCSVIKYFFVLTKPYGIHNLKAIISFK
jgi:hypothetical protein